MARCSRKNRAMLNTDIFYALADQLEADHARDSLQSLSRTSKALGTICRGRLFKRIKLDVHDRDGIALFGAILDRDPQVSRFVRHLSITDTRPPTSCTMAPSPHRGQRVGNGPSASLDVERYSEITQERSTLSAVLLRLRNLMSAAILFEYVFSGHNQPPLRWNELSFATRFLLQQDGLTTTRLEGIRCIPISLSNTFLSMEDVSLSKCTFSRSLANDQHNLPTHQSKRVSLKRLSLEWLEMGEEANENVESTSILSHWAYLSCHGIAQLPEIAHLSLALGCWPSITEAGLFLNVFQHSICSLSLNTNGLHLEPLRILPLYQAALDRSIRSLATLDSRSIQYLISQGITTLADGWATHDLQPISLKHACSPKVQSLELSATYWATSRTRTQNGEMAWICDMLADLPDERARMIDALSIKIKMGNHLMHQDTAVALMMQFAEDGMWCFLNETLAKDKWSSLRKLEITASVPAITAHRNVKTFPTLVAAHVRDNCLYDLNRRGILRLRVQTDM